MDRVSKVIGHLSPASKTPLVVVVSGAVGPLAYAILFAIGRGDLLGDQPIELRLLDKPELSGKLKGVEMELNDCAFSPLVSVTCAGDYKSAFTGAELVLLLCVDAGASSFAEQAQAIDRYSSRGVRVVVAGGSANTNCLVCIRSAPSLDPSSFTAVTRLQQNRTRALLARELASPACSLSGVFVWGGSQTQCPDVSQVRVCGQAPLLPVTDDRWLSGFIPRVQKRADMSRGRALSGPIAAACIQHARDLLSGSEDIVSMGVLSRGEYGVPRGIVFSFPCRCRDGSWEIVEDISLSALTRQRMADSARELTEERQAIL